MGKILSPAWHHLERAKIGTYSCQHFFAQPWNAILSKSQLEWLMRELFLPLLQAHAAILRAYIPATSPTFPLQGTRHNNLLGILHRGERLGW